MYQRQSPTKDPEKRQKSGKKVEQISTIKRSRISNYPYYPVSDCLSKNNISYIFNLDFTNQDYVLMVVPFLSSTSNDKKVEYTQLTKAYIQLDCVPRKNVNFLKVIQFEDSLDSNSKGIAIKYVDFVIGFSAGFLIRLRYRNKSDNSKRQLNIIGKYNKKPDHKQGFIMRMSTTFFGSQQFYKVAQQKPVRSFMCHSSKTTKNPITQKYFYSYLIGNHLYLCRQFTEQAQSEALQVFSNIEWQNLPNESQAKLNKINAIAIKSKRHKTLISSSYMMIEWTDQISSYCYNSDNQLIVSDNEDNKIIIFDVLDNLRIKAIYRLDLDVKKLNYFRTSVMGSDEAYLIVMPYDTALYIINLTKNTVTSVIGHRSYVTQAILNDSGYIITGGCDHRIGIKNLQKLKQDWININLIKGSSNSQIVTRYYQIDSSNVPRCKLDETYFLGEFNNVNSERNNNYEYGFGNFMHVPNTFLYAYITYDFIVKMYKLNV